MELIPYLIGSFVVAFYGAIKRMQVKNYRKRVEELEHPKEWEIQVGTPRQLVEPTRVSVAGTYHDVTETRHYVDQNQDLIVRVAKGVEKINLGVVRVNEDDFDDKLQELIAKAEDRRTTLAALDEYKPLP